MFKLYDEKGNNYSTLFCTLERLHKGNHRHILEWPPATPAKVRLSQKQQQVMTWANGGWELVCAHGCAVYVNGVHICNLDSVTKLIKLGLLEQTGQFTYAKPKPPKTT
jgi:hypothetical protein